MVNIRQYWRSGVIALAVAGAVTVPAVALAQSAQPSATAHGVSVADAAAGARAGSLAAGIGEDGRRGPRVDLDALASALGVTTEELAAAIESARDTVGRPEPGSDPAAHRDAFVSALAAALGVDRAAVDAATAEHGLPRAPHGPHARGERIEALATTLGVTVDDVRAAVEQAKDAVERPAPGEDMSTYRDAVVDGVAAALRVDRATLEAAIGDGPFPFGRPHPGRRGAGARVLAETLGVTDDALRAAVAQVRGDLGRPEAGTDRAAHRAQFMAALAGELGIDDATLEAAVGDRPFLFGRPHGRHGRGPSPSAPTGDESVSAGTVSIRLARG